MYNYVLLLKLQWIRKVAVLCFWNYDDVYCTTGTIGCKYMYLIVIVRQHNFKVSLFWFYDAITMCDGVVMREIVVPFTN